VGLEKLEILGAVPLRKKIQRSRVFLPEGRTRKRTVPFDVVSSRP
jgi:hypothetical protein